jgi:hypothetical protein
MIIAVLVVRASVMEEVGVGVGVVEAVVEVEVMVT